MPGNRKQLALIILTVFAVLFHGLPLFASHDEIVCENTSLVFGMSTALSGPAADLGINMQAGFLAAFHEINHHGGIKGRLLCLITLDDGYEPARTGPNTVSLIEKHNVLALVGNVGTPTAVVSIPLANRNKVPFFGAFTGAGVLRKTPPDRYVINYRASYAEETAAMVDSLVNSAGLKPDEIAFFTQRDAYGDAGFFGGVAALRKNGLKDERLVTHGRYERNTLAVQNGLADILLADPVPKAVIMVGAYAPCAEFIKLSKRVGFHPLFLNVSFVGTDSLIKVLGKDSEGMIVTQVVPGLDSDLPIINDYTKALRAYRADLDPSYGSLEGYIAARILARALKTINGPIDREAIVDALEGLGEFDLGLGITLRFGRNEHQASHAVWPTLIRNGNAIPFDWRELSGVK